MMTGVVAFLLLLITLLAIPVTLTFHLSWPQTCHSYIKLQWAFGLINAQLPPFQSKTPTGESKELVQEIKIFRHSNHKKQKFFIVIRQKSFRRRIIRFICDFWHAVHKKDVSLRIRIGLGDPADTGQLWAIVGPMAGVLSNFKETYFDIEPEFFETVFELDSNGSVRLIPLQIIYLTTGMLLSPPVWQGIRQIRKAE